MMKWLRVFVGIIVLCTGITSESLLFGAVNTETMVNGQDYGLTGAGSGARSTAKPRRAGIGPGGELQIGGTGTGSSNGVGTAGGLATSIPTGDVFVAVNISTATTTRILAGTATLHLYVTSLNVVTAAANNVAVISGTGATCGTGTVGIAGGTTAATGWNLAANGGLALGSGFGAVMRTAAKGDSICIVTSANTQLSGTMVLTQF